MMMDGINYEIVHGKWEPAEPKVKKEFNGEKCFVEFRESQKLIFARDKEDMNNEPAMFTRSKRNIKKVWAKIEAEFSDETTLYNIIEICREFNIKTHSWCMVD